MAACVKAAENSADTAVEGLDKKIAGQFILTKSKIELTNQQLAMAQGELAAAQEALICKAELEDYSHFKGDVYEKYATMAAVEAVDMYAKTRAGWEELRHVQTLSDANKVNSAQLRVDLDALGQKVEQLEAELNQRMTTMAGSIEENKARAARTRADLTNRLEALDDCCKKTS